MFEIIITGIFMLVSAVAGAIVGAIMHHKSTKKHYSQINKQEVECPSEKESNYLFFMAMTQPPYEPIRYKLLEQCIEKYKNPFAAIVLTIYYEYGTYHENNLIEPINRNKAFNIYKKCLKSSDVYGVISWQLGWYYENDYIANDVDNIKQLSKPKRLKMAFNYYTQSSDSGFAKAFNSLGKFYENGIHVDKDESKAFLYYEKGKEAGDIFASLNGGRMARDIFNQPQKAIEYYTVASKQGNNQAHLELAKMYENDTSKSLEEVINLYIKALSPKNQFSAISYYRLGDLIKSNNNFDHEDLDSIIKLPENLEIYKYFNEGIIIPDNLQNEKNNRLAISCYISAYEILLGLFNSKKKLCREANTCYIKLLMKFLA